MQADKRYPSHQNELKRLFSRLVRIRVDNHNALVFSVSVTFLSRAFSLPPFSLSLTFYLDLSYFYLYGIYMSIYPLSTRTQLWGGGAKCTFYTCVWVQHEHLCYMWHSKWPILEIIQFGTHFIVNWQAWKKCMPRNLVTGNLKHRSPLCELFCGVESVAEF